ncbi:transketolase [Alphaproteobacteria bacterium]|nr:transketolase [Alphaproteobacteria bacterium]
MVYKDLENKAAEIRIKCLEDTVRAGKGHLGGCYSCVELLVALYYSNFLKVNAENPKDPERDFFFLGKGHACLALYPILNDLGFLSNERYLEYGKNGSSIGGQLDLSIPGVENNTGSLGHALGLAAGVAYAAKKSKRASKAVALLGDAECDEGAIWEAIIFAAEHSLDNLYCIVDRNRLSVTSVIESSVIFDNFVAKMNSFGWHCVEVDGHNYVSILDALEHAKPIKKPTIILANTIKGKGVSFMEGVTKWHHSVPSEKEVEIAYEELGFKR